MTKCLGTHGSVKLKHKINHHKSILNMILTWFHPVCMYAKSLQLCPTLWHNCCPPSSSIVGFSGQEYWSRLSLHPPGHLPYPEIKPTSPSLTGRFFTTVSPGKPWHTHAHTHKHIHNKIGVTKFVTITVSSSVTCYLIIAGNYLLQFSTTHSDLPLLSVSVFTWVWFFSWWVT